MAVGEARVPLLADKPLTHQHQHHESVQGVSVLGHGSLGRPTIVVTSLVAGACAGALAKTTIAPLDRTKINFQVSHIPYSWRAALAFVARTVRSEGVLALWRGNSATMARIVPYAAIQFTAHEQCKKALHVDTPARAKQHPYKHLVAGSMAGVISQSATYPLDLARARMAVTNAAEYPSLWAVFRKVARDEGLLTLYRGYPATVLGVIPYAGVSFFMYDTMKHKYLEYFGSTQGVVTNMAFGGCAGALAQTASYPLDIVRRRMQTCRPGGGTGGGDYTTILTTARTVYCTEGLRGFFKGLSMNWVKGPIAVGISFATYDSIRGALRDLALRVSS